MKLNLAHLTQHNQKMSIDEHGSFMSAEKFANANMARFLKDLYTNQLCQLCDDNLENTPQFKIIKEKVKYWNKNINSEFNVNETDTIHA